MSVCPNCGERNPRENTVCRSCGAVLNVEPPPAQEQAEERVEPKTPEEVLMEREPVAAPAAPSPETQNLNVPRGAIFGAVVALLSGVAWYFIELKTPAWFMPAIAGMAIGMAVSLGAGRKRGRVLQWISLGLLAGTALIVEFLVLGLANPAGFLNAFSARMRADQFGWVFLVFGLLQAYITPAPRRRRPAPQSPAGQPRQSGTAAAPGTAPGEESSAAAGDQGLRCFRCDKVMTPEETLSISGGVRGRPAFLCQQCVTEIEAHFQAETQNIQWPGTVMFGVGTAALFATVWYLVEHYAGWNSFMAFGSIVAGLGISTAISYGSGKKLGRPLQWLAAGLTVLAVLAGEFAATGPAGFTSTMGERLQNPLILLLLLLGPLQAFMNLARHRLPKMQPYVPPESEEEAEKATDASEKQADS